MARIFNVHPDRLGRSPGTLEFLGRQKIDAIRVRAVVYGPRRLEPYSVEDILAGEGPGPGEVLWLDIIGLHDTGLLARLGERFGLDPLALEDVVATNQRAKTDDLGTSLFTVCRWSNYHPEKEMVETEQISLFLGADFVLSFQEREPDSFTGVRSRLEQGRGRLRTAGASYLANALLDEVVDDHLLTISRVGDRIEALEEEMLDRVTSDQLGTLHHLKRELLLLRRAVRPMREMTWGMMRLETNLINEATRSFLADVHDHSIQAADAVESYQEMLAGLHEFYQSTVGQRLNEVMKVLTIISTIFVPMTFVAGIYGMNFEFMPELGWRWAYPVFWGVVCAMCTGMLVFFRRRRWF
jgi:magnesium transporter